MTAELTHQINVLWRHVELRPLDIDAQRRLAFLTYEKKDFKTSLRCIRKTLQIYADESKRDSDGSRTRPISTIDMEQLKWRHGKCLLRRWMKYGETSDLEEASTSYKVALRNGQIKILWETYFEIASILLRLGDTQGCLDTYGACIVLFPDRRELLLVTQYNIAQVLFVNGRMNEALEIYRELMLLTEVGHVTSDDFVSLQTTRIKSLNISLEIARILYRKGEKELARSSFQETWSNFKEYEQPKLAKNKNYGFDLLMGHVSFSNWMVDPVVWKAIAEYFRKEKNFVFAAEFYSNSAEILTLVGWERIRKQGQQMLVDVILLRANCMREICKYEQAEVLALTAYNMMPRDPVVIGRAARCCRSKSEEVQELQADAQFIMKYFVELYAMLRMNAYRSRIRKLRFLHESATKVNSIIRMALVRNRTAELRLSGVKIKGILPLVHSLRSLFKTGAQSVKNWMQVWNICAVTIQNFLQSWLRKRKFKIFWKGMKSLKRIFRGQLTRLRCRNAIEEIQTELELSPDAKTRECIDIRIYPIFVDVFSVDFINSGSRVFSDSTYDFNYRTDQRLGAAYVSKYDSESSTSTSYSISNDLPKSIYGLEMFLATDRGHDEDVITIIGCPRKGSGVRVKWVPFGMLAEAAVSRLLVCSSLVITSPSFSMTDCKKLCAVVEKSKHRLWKNIRCLLVKGTCMGPSGLSKIIELGMQNLQTLNITSVGITHHFGDYIGGPCRSDKTSEGHSKSSISKLYIDSEPLFGDRGCVKLMKHLQFNTELQTLSLTNCKLGSRSAILFAKYCATSTSLRVLTLTENNMKREDCLSILRAVANRGSKGCLRTVNLQDQEPKLTHAEVVFIDIMVKKMTSSIKLYSTLLPADEDALYSVLDIEAEASKLIDEEVFAATENQRIKDIISKTSYEDTDAFQKIVAGVNCFTKTVYI